MNKDDTERIIGAGPTTGRQISSRRVSRHRYTVEAKGQAREDCGWKGDPGMSVASE